MTQLASLAIGANTASEGRLGAGEFLVLMVAGLTVELATTLAASRFLRTMLFGVAPTDISILVIASVIVTTIAVLATVVPAVRASAIDPMEVWRHE